MELTQDVCKRTIHVGGKHGRVQMCITNKVIVLVLTLLASACTTFPQSEQQSEILTQTVDAETPLDPATEFEEAKRECADQGGKWVGYSHGRGFTYYTYSMRCWSRDDPPRRPGDGRWGEPGLLPYDVLVRYSRETHKVTDFGRIERNSKVHLNNGDQDTSDQPE